MDICRYLLNCFVAIATAVSVCRAETSIKETGTVEMPNRASVSPKAPSERGTIKANQLRLAIDLVDGSHVIGVPRIKSIPVQTSYAKMDIPIRQIRSIKFHDDHEGAAINIVNGDKVNGVLDLQPLELETVFGKVSIAVEHVQFLRFRTETERSLLEIAPAKVDALDANDYYATSRTHDLTNHRLLGLMDARAGKILQKFDDWIFLHPTSSTKTASVLYDFSDPVARFDSTIRTVSAKGSVRYAIYADGKLVYDAVLHSADGPRQISVSLGKCRALKIEVGAAGPHPWGAWGEPRIYE